MQKKARYKIYAMKSPKEGFEQKIKLLIEVNHTLNTRYNSAVGRKIVFTYSLNEEKGLQE